MTTATLSATQPTAPPNESGPEKMLQALAARNAVTETGTARKKRFQLARDLKAIEQSIGRKLEIPYLRLAFDAWHRASQPFLDPEKTRDFYEASFLSEVDKVRVPTGEGDTLQKALEAVAKLKPNDLPEIPDMPDAPESWRRLAALHRELARLSANGEYFLSYRSAIKIGMPMSSAHAITGALIKLGVLEIVSRGKSGKRGKASVFRYLLPLEEEIEL